MSELTKPGIHAYNIKTTNLKVNVVKVRFLQSKILVNLHNKGGYDSNKLNITNGSASIQYKGTKLINESKWLN